MNASCILVPVQLLSVGDGLWVSFAAHAWIPNVRNMQLTRGTLKGCSLKKKSLLWKTASTHESWRKFFVKKKQKFCCCCWICCEESKYVVLKVRQSSSRCSVTTVYLSTTRMGWFPWTSMAQEEADMIGWQPFVIRLTSPVSLISQCEEQSLESETKHSFLTSLPPTITGLQTTWSLSSASLYLPRKAAFKDPPFSSWIDSSISSDVSGSNFKFAILSTYCRSPFNTKGILRPSMPGAPLRLLFLLLLTLWAFGTSESVSNFRFFGGKWKWYCNIIGGWMDGWIYLWVLVLPPL